MQKKIHLIRRRITAAAAAVLLVVFFSAAAAGKDRSVSVAAMGETDYVYPCGCPVGIYIRTRGVLVAGTSDIVCSDSSVKAPCEGILQAGDYITYANGNRICSRADIAEWIQQCGGQPVTLHIIRDNTEFDASVMPAIDASGRYRLGIWVKDDVQGIGTLTFITGDGRFGALGHPINDNDTGKRVLIDNGGLYRSCIQMIIKGVNGKPGSFSGMICYDSETFLGNISKNDYGGIFGNINPKEIAGLAAAEPVKVMPKSEVRTGPARLRCQLNGVLKDYDIEIIRTGTGAGEDGLMVRVTDPELLELTGGIIQGMSGSPILQDDKLAGAITHVFVNDPAKGYGIYIETMLKEGIE